MAVETAKLTLEEFMQLPDRPNVDLELCDGEVVEVPLPSGYHMQLQDRLSELLRSLIAGQYYVRLEFGYGFQGEGHRADVAAVGLARWRATVNSRASRTLPFAGAPELLIEILSPSNTAMELNRLRNLCFQNGCLQFWEVDPGLRIVTVFALNSDPRVYRSPDTISLRAITGGPETVAVDQIFAPPK